MCLLLTKLIENKQVCTKEKNNKQTLAEGNEQVSSEEENDLWYLMIVQNSTTKVYKQLLILFWDHPQILPLILSEFKLIN